MELQVTVSNKYNEVIGEIVHAFNCWLTDFGLHTQLKYWRYLNYHFTHKPIISENFSWKLVANPSAVVLNRRIVFLLFKKTRRWDRRDWYIVLMPKSKFGCELEALARQIEPEPLTSNTPYYWSIGRNVTLNVDGRIYDKRTE